MVLDQSSVWFAFGSYLHLHIAFIHFITRRSKEQRRHFRSAHDNDEADPLSHWHVRTEKMENIIVIYINPFRSEWVFIKASTYARKNFIHTIDKWSQPPHHQCGLNAVFPLIFIWIYKRTTCNTSCHFNVLFIHSASCYPSIRLFKICSVCQEGKARPNLYLHSSERPVRDCPTWNVP